MDDSEQEDIEEVGLGLDQAEVVISARTLSTAGKFLEVVAIVAALGLLIGGISLVVHTNTDALGNVTHPTVGPGIGLIVGSVIGGVFYWALARGLRVFADYTSTQVRAIAHLLDVQYNVRSARGKECPDCLEDVWDDARVCPHCSYRFEPADHAHTDRPR